MRKYLYVLGIILLDQVIKQLFINLFPNLVVFNEQIVFGLFFPYPFAFYVLMLVILFLLIVFSGSKFKISLFLIAGGGLSNLIDRLFQAGVVDIKLYILPATNLADLIIIAGVILVAYNLLKSRA